MPTCCRRLQQFVADGQRVLVFTQSQRTAEYLERELRGALAGKGVARIDSRIEPKTRAAILHAFCPGYNPPPPQHAPSIPARLDVLISTDVLSEGVNLQEAGAILSYDIHWNPVRLIQRIGRVDRRLRPGHYAARSQIRNCQCAAARRKSTILSILSAR